MNVNSPQEKYLSFKGSLYSLRKHLMLPLLLFSLIFYFEISKKNIKIGSFPPYKQEVRVFNKRKLEIHI